MPKSLRFASTMWRKILERRQLSLRYLVGVPLVVVVGYLLLQFGSESRVENQVVVTVVVTPVDVGSESLDEVADRLDYADEIIRVFLRDQELFQKQTKTLFVPLDEALERELATIGRDLSDLNSTSSLTRRLSRIHSSATSLSFRLIAESESVSFQNFAGQQLRAEVDRSDGTIYIVRSDSTRVKIVATEVFVGDVVVHLIDAPIALPSQD